MVCTLPVPSLFKLKLLVKHKQTKMKKVIAIFAVAATLVACGGNGNGSATATDSTAVDSTVVDTTAVAVDSAKVDTASVVK